MSAPPGQLRTDVSKIDDAMAVRMAQRFESAGDMGSALNMYRRAVLVAPENTTALHGMARIFALAGAQEEAARYYSRILQLQPRDSRAAVNVAENHIFKGDARQAISFINEFMVSASGTSALFNVLGIAHDLNGAHGDAQLAYAAGLDLAPNDAAITSNLALSFAVREDYQTALALLERVLGDSSRSDEEGRSIARQNLALVYALSGQLETALEIAGAVLSAEEVAINRTFYARLPGLDSKAKAKAVFLGSLPSPQEDREEAATTPEEQTGPVQAGQPFAPPSSEAERDAAASRIVRGLGREWTIPEPPAAEAGIQEADIEAIGNEVGNEQARDTVAADDYPPYWVQLGSYRSPERARAGWNTLSTQFPDLLAGYVGYLKTYQSEDRGQFFRLMVQASETRSAANLVCGTFKVEGMDCLVIRTRNNIGLLQEAE
ncbi:MAG: SPOR domain-containing protein [Proteobacteria bacterium]|nr:SPOR domain-containing protein [Pseudomonadota bacterium]